MDCRLTLERGNNFIAILRNCADTGKKVALLVDENGLDRAEGFIKSMKTDTDHPYIEMENGRQIKCSTIVAVNGVFLDNYSEC